MLDSVGFAQKRRLAFIDFCLMFKGAVYRQDIVKKFGVGLSAASCDIKLYATKAPKNLFYSHKNKRYFRTVSFKPIFKFDAHKTLVKLAHNVLDSFDIEDNVDFPVIMQTSLYSLDIDVIAHIIRSIMSDEIIDVTYTSETTTSSTLQLVPHSVFYSGLHWYLRALERELGKFNNFALNRIANVIHLKDKISENETAKADEQWTTFIELHLVPHPKNAKRPALIQKDFNMEFGVLKLSTRAATAGYLLQHWNVDCSKDAKLVGDKYVLHLHNVDSFTNVESLMIAPGF
jgi:hypothetical protein